MAELPRWSRSFEGRQENLRQNITWPDKDGILITDNPGFRAGLRASSMISDISLLDFVVIDVRGMSFRKE